ncbi:MAG: polysaccharide biosynthesis protein [Planctomycetota bacterium]|jgi:FlaA1/EpsC-like NDP-sugar epimerase
MSQRTLIVGLRATCRRVEAQLALLDAPPEVVGWILPAGSPTEVTPDAARIIGVAPDLERLVGRHRPDLVIVSLPAVMSGLVTRVRTRLRRLGVPDRFMPTLEDQLAGVGPRSQLDVDLDALLDRRARPVDPAAIRSVIEGRRVMITGAGGSIGGELARLVAGYGPARLDLIDRSENALFEIDRQVARVHPDLPRTTLLHDIVERDATDWHLDQLRPDVIFHAAAHKHVPMMEDHPAAAVDNNLFGTKSVVDAADRIGVERFVMISTDKAVNPSSIMGATKRLAELYVQHINRRSTTAFTIVRFGNVLGSSGSVLDTWARQISDGGPVTVTDAEMTRYFMTIPEAASLVVQASALVDPSEEGGEVFLLDMGEPIRIVEMAQRFIEAHGLVPVQAGEDDAETAGTARIVFTGARPGEKLHEDLSFDAEAMRTTTHPDINVWLLAPPEEGSIQAMIGALGADRRPGDPVALAASIRRLVPGMVAAHTAPAST